MYCPKCASPAIAGQRFCRACGTNLGLILDAMEGKRSPLDFETLKADLRELGANLRAGFEEARQGFNQGVKKRQKFPQSETPPPPVQVRVKQVRGGNTRQYSLQQAMLSIFGGGSMAGALYYLLNTAAGSGLLTSLERELLQKAELTNLAGFASVFQALWVIGLIPVAKGVAHLVNGVFFAAKPEPEIKEVVVTTPAEVNFTAASSLPPLPERDTNELDPDPRPEPKASITEDETLRLERNEFTLGKR